MSRVGCEGEKCLPGTAPALLRGTEDGGPPPGGAGGALGALPNGLDGAGGFRDIA
jgi:hypothetical protein